MSLPKKKIFILMLVTLFFTNAVGVTLAKAAPAPLVGVVDYLYLINNHPDTAKANEVLKTEQEQAKKDFEARSAGMDDKEKRTLDLQLGQRLEQKRQELLKPIVEEINAAIKEVCAAKGLSVVLGKNVVIYGGVDITEEILKKLNKK